LDNSFIKDAWNFLDDEKIIVAFFGRAGSGKDYQCNLLQKQGYVKLAFADALRDIAYTSLGIEDRTPEHYDNLKAHNCIGVQDSWDNSEILSIDSSSTGHYLNFRQFLERLGTQGIRKYDNDFWCRCLVKTLSDNEYKKVCISDMRFPNEYYYLKRFADKNDYKFKAVFCDYHSDRYQDNNKHESAKMSNWFANHGCKDLEEISENDVENYITCGMYVELK
jgi:hypothetical protein